MRVNGCCVSLVIVAGLAVGAPSARSADNQKTSVGDEVVVTERGGTRFLSLRDWPVKEEGNVVRPVTMEEYLSLKFTQVGDALSAVERRLTALERKLQSLEEEQAKVQAQVRLLEAAVSAPKGQGTGPQEESHGDTKEEREAARPQGERP